MKKDKKIAELTAEKKELIEKALVDCTKIVNLTLENNRLKDKNKVLQHEYDSSRGLWCTDKPELLSPYQKEQFFQLGVKKDDENQEIDFVKSAIEQIEKGANEGHVANEATVFDINKVEEGSLFANFVKAMTDVKEEKIPVKCWHSYQINEPFDGMEKCLKCGNEKPVKFKSEAEEKECSLKKVVEENKVVSTKEKMEDENETVFYCTVVGNRVRHVEMPRKELDKYMERQIEINKES